MKEIIHVFGDSHVSLFSGVDQRAKGFPNEGDTILDFRTYEMGPVLAYTLINRLSQLQEWIGLYNIKSLMLYIGEIDVRIHIVKHARIDGISISESTRKVVERYVDGIMQISKLVDDVIIFGPHPQYKQKNGKVKDEHFGTYEEIYEAGRLFNLYLRSHDVRTVSLFDTMMEHKLNEDMAYYMDSFHLKPTMCLPMALDLLKQEEKNYDVHK